MSRISGNANFTPVTPDSTEASDVSSSSAQEQVCCADGQNDAPVDTIQAHDGFTGGPSYEAPATEQDGEAHPAYLLQASNGELPAQGAKFASSSSHPEGEFVPTEQQRVWVKNEETHGKWKEQAAKKDAAPKPKFGEIELAGASFEKRSSALYSVKGDAADGKSSLKSEFNVGQLTAAGSSALSVNVKEGEVSMGAGASVSADLINARIAAASEIGGVKINSAVDAKVGVEAHVGTKETFNWKKKEAEAAVGAGITLARVGAQVSAEEGGVGVVAKADAEYGLELNASLHIGQKNGKYEVKIDEAFAFGIGEHANLAVDIDPAELRETAEKVADFGADLGHAAKAAVGDAARAVIDNQMSHLEEDARMLQRLRELL